VAAAAAARLLLMAVGGGGRVQALGQEAATVRRRAVRERGREGRRAAAAAAALKQQVIRPRASTPGPAGVRPCRRREAQPRVGCMWGCVVAEGARPGIRLRIRCRGVAVPV
jgi:hypothetical protein